MKFDKSFYIAVGGALTTGVGLGIVVNGNLVIGFGLAVAGLWAAIFGFNTTSNKVID